MSQNQKVLKKSYSDVEETEYLKEAFYASWSVSRHTPNYSIFTADFVPFLNFGLVWEVQLGLGLGWVDRTNTI